MKKTALILLILLIHLQACEKNAERPYNLRFYGDAYQDIGYSVLTTNDGYVIAGQLTVIKRKDGNTIESSNKNIGIIKVNWNGDVIWTVTAGGKYDDSGSKIYQLTDGSLICTGTYTDTTGTTPGTKDIYVLKLSPAGTVIWEKTYGGAGNQTGTDIIKTPEGFMVLGTTDVAREPLSDSTGNKAGFSDIYFLRISENGDFIDSKAWGYPENDIPRVIKSTGDGNFCVFGTTDMINVKEGQLKSNMLFLKSNSVANVTESKIIGGPDNEFAADMEVLDDGYLIVGTIGKETENQQIYISKLKKNIFAEPFYKKSVSVADPNNPALTSCGVNSVSRYGTDSFVLAGYTGFITSAKMMVFEIDATGNEVEGHKMINGSTGTEVAYDVITGDDGYIIAVGRNTYDLNSMITFLKFKF
jgi:hypothetical protein